MNAIELKSRATFLMNRLNEMGFRKDGKELVVDHAYELVAAEEGHRNQHILRTKLSAYPALFIPQELDEEFAKAVCVVTELDDDDWRYANDAWSYIIAEAAKRAGVTPVTRESERAAEQAWINVVNRMGWNDQSEVLHLEGFIREKGLMGELAKYAETVGAEEESFGTDSDMPSEAVIDALKAIGYDFTISEFSRLYWEFEDEASTDFETEAGAWADAWANAQKRAAGLSGTDMATWSGFEEGVRISLVSSRLGKSLLDRNRVLADQVFEAYDFGEFLTVEGSGSWEWSHGDTLAARSVFLTDSRTPDADSVRYRLAVELRAGEAVRTHLSAG